MSVLLDALKKAEKENKAQASSAGLSGEASLDFSDQSLAFPESLEDDSNQKHFFKVSQDVTLPQSAGAQSKQLWFLAGFSALIFAVVALFFIQKENQSVTIDEQPEQKSSDIQSVQALTLMSQKESITSAEIKKETPHVESNSNKNVLDESVVKKVYADKKQQPVEDLQPQKWMSNEERSLVNKNSEQKALQLKESQSKKIESIEQPKKTKSLNLSETKKSGQEKNRKQTNKKVWTIKRSKTLTELVNEGYALYQEGEYGSSLSKYSQAYRKAPNNKDALLGMVATHTKLGQPDLANVYRQKLITLGFDSGQLKQSASKNDVAGVSTNVLSTPPKNPVQNNLGKLIAQLKETPNDARLNFMLATEYAKKNDWKNAQNYYFKAHRFMPNNPSYAFNLAVSLEHLGHSKAALNFYEKTKVLMRSSPSEINPITVARRLDALSQRVETGLVR